VLVKFGCLEGWALAYTSGILTATYSPSQTLLLMFHVLSTGKEEPSSQSRVQSRVQIWLLANALHVGEHIFHSAVCLFLELSDPKRGKELVSYDP
jgi:hypothetical protein